MWSSLSNYRDGALLFLRVALGSFYIWIHGWSRLAAGVMGWKKAGLIMKQIGIESAPAAWGFMGASAATVAVVLLILGFCFRPACLFIFLTLALISFIGIEANGVGKTHHSIEFAIVVLSLLFLGPGRFSIDKG